MSHVQREPLYISGAACPARGTAAGLILPYVNTEAMGIHLEEIAKAVAPGPHALMIVDGAGWHCAKAVDVPDNITLLKLPLYAPELNPPVGQRMENVWACLRANKRGIPVFDSHRVILNKCQDAWNVFASVPDRITSITSRNRITVDGSSRWYEHLVFFCLQISPPEALGLPPKHAFSAFDQTVCPCPSRRGGFDAQPGGRPPLFRAV